MTTLPTCALYGAQVDGIYVYRFRKGWQIDPEAARARVAALDGTDSAAPTFSGMTGGVAFRALTRAQLDDVAAWRENLIRRARAQTAPTRRERRTARDARALDAARRSPRTIVVSARSLA